MYNTQDIREIFINKLKNQDFRITKDGTKTVEVQAIQFIADKDWIVREPDYDYAKREIEWYESQSKNVMTFLEKFQLYGNKLRTLMVT